MSASLVGSEMCIRDRRRAGGHRAAREVFLEPSSLSRSRHRGSDGCSPSFCLLYTSDAADDM
eukprot:2788916-Alexandrium_andersonii.AAC.1